MVIYLVGFMGCGKSTSGRQLARHLSYEFIDLDIAFEDQEKIKIPDYFEKFGEEKFRYIEHQILRNIDHSKDVVVATGGGTPCFYDNMEYMKSKGVTVYLQLPSAILCQRLIKSHNIRPKIAGKEPEELQNWVDDLIKERSSFYKKAHIIIDARTLTPAMLTKVIGPYLSHSV